MLDDIMKKEKYDNMKEQPRTGRDERDTKNTPAGRYMSRTCYYIADYYKKILFIRYFVYD